MQTAGPLTDRVKTGPLRFSSEPWPGVFVRGDDAMYVEAVLRKHAESLPDGLERKAAMRFADLFAACQIGG